MVLGGQKDHAELVYAISTSTLCLRLAPVVTQQVFMHEHDGCVFLIAKSPIFFTSSSPPQDSTRIQVSLMKICSNTSARAIAFNNRPDALMKCKLLLERMCRRIIVRGVNNKGTLYIYDTSVTHLLNCSMIRVLVPPSCQFRVSINLQFSCIMNEVGLIAQAKLLSNCMPCSAWFWPGGSQ